MARRFRNRPFKRPRKRRNPFQLRTGKPFKMRKGFRQRRRKRRVAVPGVGPAKAFVNFKACLRVIFTFGTTKTAVVFDLTPNNMIDPFGGASSSVQCLGWDQWMAFYNRYRVTSIRVNLKWAKEIAAGAHNLPAAVGYHLTQTAGEITDTDSFATICDLPRTRWRYIPANDDTAQTQTASQTMVIKPQSLFKATDQREFDTLIATPPTLIPKLQLFVTGADQSTLANDTTFVSCLVTYQIQGFFYDRLQLPISAI